MRLIKIGYTEKKENEIIYFEQLVNFEHTIVELNDKYLYFRVFNTVTKYEYATNLDAKKAYQKLLIKLHDFKDGQTIAIRKEDIE